MYVAGTADAEEGPAFHAGSLLLLLLVLCLFTLLLLTLLVVCIMFD